MPKNKKKKNETKIPDVKFFNAKDAHPGMYGKHGDNCFFNLDENTTHAHVHALRACTSCVIGLDPGHANILAIARTDRDTIIPTTYVLPNKYSLISFEWKSEKHDMKCNLCTHSFEGKLHAKKRWNI